jgi:chorismate synthase
MSINSFGRILRVTTWGESHGPAIGCVVDGVPAHLTLSEDYIQTFLDQRKPGTHRFVTQRREDDKVRILSGVLNNTSTGMPISLLIENKDTKSSDYQNLEKTFRPGHADYTYWKKYGIRDHRGGGRSSARETACRVAAGAIARQIIKPLITIQAALIQIGNRPIKRELFQWNECLKNPFWCPDPSTVPLWQEDIDKARHNLSSLGAIIEVVAKGVPPGLGAPVYGKLDADLAAAFMGINAVKAVEIGAGFQAASLDGHTMSGEILLDEHNQPHFSSPHSGGILGGISNGQDITLRFAVKPTSSIPQPIKTITSELEKTTLATKGRHDPCVGIRAVPIAEAMMALVLADHLILARAHNAEPPKTP